MESVMTVVFFKREKTSLEIIMWREQNVYMKSRPIVVIITVSHNGLDERRMMHKATHKIMAALLR
jgi:hypothetical protein